MHSLTQLVAEELAVPVQAGVCDFAAQIAAQYGNTGFVFERFVEWLDDALVVVHRVCHVVCHAMTAGGHDTGVQQMRDFFHHHLQAACIAKIFHQMVAGRL